ncbi:helix-turn-helix transcriptional regulator [candidate division KSB1 bacterium]|nr:helix-turn-helix transcriptional regulator [candidate division KSB1 bacterium]
MSDQSQQIALRIKDLREISGLSAASLAKKLNIPLPEYQSYESGTVDIPAGFILNVAHYFKMDMTTLLTGQNPHLHVYSLVRKGKGVPVERKKPYIYQSLGYHFQKKKVEPFWVCVEPSSVEPEMNSHPGQEFHFILEGQLQVTIDGHDLVLNEGDSLIFDSSYQHSLKALDGRPVKLLVMVV